MQLSTDNNYVCLTTRYTRNVHAQQEMFTFVGTSHEFVTARLSILSTDLHQC